ncbi:type II 3-dehydroquinate dehydratase, partial [Francisella tularensis]|uniref:type II 3-dehydroquinate dehydratase n=1 Tax=Francisella tularensis TaxID=263 RepID=UPI002381D0E4
MDVLVIKGPNLNLLGTRQPQFYGHKTLADINHDFLNIAKENNILIEFYHSTQEGRVG